MEQIPGGSMNFDAGGKIRLVECNISFGLKCLVPYHFAVVQTTIPPYEWVWQVCGESSFSINIRKG